MDPSIMIMFGLFAVMIIWMSYSGRKTREKQAARREEMIKLGTSVMTTAGFYGTIVDIDGDAITLASPAGDETVWDRRAIAQVAQLPLAHVEETDNDAEENTHVSEADTEFDDNRDSYTETSSDSEPERPSSPFAY